VKAVLRADGRVDAGGMVLVLHNERLADPLDPVTRLLASLTRKRNKTETDHAEIARVEFYGGLYMSEPITAEDGDVVVPAGSVPVVPAWNVLRCLQDGAKRHKRGPDVLRGVHPLSDDAPISYDGPTNAVELWTAGRFALRKGVGVQRSRTIRTRPIFTEWQLHLEVEVDPVVFDLDTLQTFWTDAGRYCGLGEMRPVYGRFRGTIDGDL
jgi:hypothetical protein